MIMYKCDMCGKIHEKIDDNDEISYRDKEDVIVFKVRV
jgi:DNA-directed RNA polymerase subunit RPC12/RpoP